MKNSLLWALVIVFCLAAPGLAQEKPADGKEGVQEDAGHKEEHHGKSADEIARELTNPNNSVAKLTFKNQYRWYTGDLPDADDQSNYTLLFQPVFPFKLGDSGDHKNVLFARPAFPFVFDQPVPGIKNGEFDWDGVTAMGDISMDFAYGRTYKSGWIWALGMVNSFPTASDSDIASKQWRGGPEGIVGHMSKWGLLAIFPYHMWDIAGWGDGADYSTTFMQLFAVHTAGNGWTYGTEPILSYDWESYEWTIPLELYVSKTVLLSGRPWKFELQVDYYIEQPDAFGPEWLVSFNVTPIVPNFIANWISGK